MVVTLFSIGQLIMERALLLMVCVLRNLFSVVINPFTWRIDTALQTGSKQLFRWRQSESIGSWSSQNASHQILRITWCHIWETHLCICYAIRNILICLLSFWKVVLWWTWQGSMFIEQTNRLEYLYRVYALMGLSAWRRCPQVLLTVWVQLHKPLPQAYYSYSSWNC